MLKNMKIYADEKTRNILVEIDSKIKETLHEKPEWAYSLSGEIRNKLDLDESIQKITKKIADTEDSIKTELKSSLQEEDLGFVKQEILSAFSKSLERLDEIKRILDVENIIEKSVADLTELCRNNRETLTKFDASIHEVLKSKLSGQNFDVSVQGILTELNTIKANISEINQKFTTISEIDKNVAELKEICQSNTSKINNISDKIILSDGRIKDIDNHLNYIRSKNLKIIEDLCQELHKEILELKIPWYKKIFKRRKL